MSHLQHYSYKYKERLTINPFELEKHVVLGGWWLASQRWELSDGIKGECHQQLPEQKHDDDHNHQEQHCCCRSREKKVKLRPPVLVTKYNSGPWLWEFWPSFLVSIYHANVLGVEFLHSSCVLRSFHTIFILLLLLYFNYLIVIIIFLNQQYFLITILSSYYLFEHYFPRTHITGFTM